MSEYHIWRERKYAGKVQRQTVRGNNGEPLTFPTKEQAEAARAIFNVQDPDWHYHVGEPVATEWPLNFSMRFA